MPMLSRKEAIEKAEKVWNIISDSANYGFN